MTMIIDTAAAARRAEGERLADWLEEQRVFISSAMSDTAAEREAVAELVTELGARAVRFEEFGRDADPEEAYLSEVDSSTIYVGILNELYGRLNPPDGFAATEMEYMRARERGKRVSVLIADSAPQREGHLSRFIDRVRFHVTTENFTNTADLSRRVRRRLEELASEAVSPWLKLGALVFRADEIQDSGSSIEIRARVCDDIAHALETLRDARYARPRLRFVSRVRIAEGELASVRRTTRAVGAEEVTIDLANIESPRADAMRAATGGYSPDELVELGLRSLFLGEALPSTVGVLSFMTDTGINRDDLLQAFDLTNEIAESVTRLVLVEGLVGSGNASRVVACEVGPRTGSTRRVTLAWEEPRTYVNVEPQRRQLEGEWQRP